VARVSVARRWASVALRGQPGPDSQSFRWPPSRLLTDPYLVWDVDLFAGAVGAVGHPAVLGEGAVQPSVTGVARGHHSDGPTSTESKPITAAPTRRSIVSISLPESFIRAADTPGQHLLAGDAWLPGRHADAEDRELPGDPVELRQRGVTVHRHMGPSSRGQVEVAAQNRRAGADLDLFEVDGLTAAMAQRHVPAGRADITDPVRLLAEHRHQIALTMVVRDNHREGDDAAGAPTRHLQGHPVARRQKTGREVDGRDPVHQQCQAIRAAAPVQPAVEPVEALRLGDASMSSHDAHGHTGAHRATRAEGPIDCAGRGISCRLANVSSPCESRFEKISSPPLPRVSQTRPGSPGPAPSGDSVNACQG